MTDRYDMTAARHAATTVTRLTALAGQPWYLSAEDAVVWFRADHPTADIDTTIIFLDEFEGAERCVCKTKIALADGGGAAGIGQVRFSAAQKAPKGHHFDHIEKAQSKSVRRALEQVGYSLAQLIALGAWTTPRGQGNAQPTTPTPNGKTPQSNAPAALQEVKQPTVSATQMLANVSESDLVDWREYVRGSIAAKEAPRTMYDDARDSLWAWLVIVQELPTVEALQRIANTLQSRNITDPTVWYEVQSRIAALTPKGNA